MKLRAANAKRMLNQRIGLSVLALLLLGTGACRQGESEPAKVVRSFADAVNRGDPKAILEFLEPRALEMLEQGAQRASDQVGGRRQVLPHELLQVTRLDPTFVIVKVEDVAVEGAGATVRVLSNNGESVDISLVLFEGQWKISLPIPPALSSGVSR